MSLKLIVGNFFKQHVFIVLQDNELIETLFYDENALNYCSVAYVELSNKLVSLNSFYAENDIIKNVLVVKNKNYSLEKSQLCYCSKLVSDNNKLHLLKKGIVLNGYFCSLSYNEIKGKGALLFKNINQSDLEFSLKDLKHNDFVLEFNKNILNFSFEVIKKEVDYLFSLANNIIEHKKSILLLQQNPLISILQKYNKDVKEIVFENILLKNSYYCSLLSNVVAKDKIVIDSMQANQAIGLDLKNEIAFLEDKNVYVSKNLTIKLHETEDFSYFDLNGDILANVLEFNLNALKVVKNIIYKRGITGQILIDLVNLRTKEDKIAFLNQVRNLFLNDSCINVASVTRLGILEISRKRSVKSLQSLFCKNSGALLSNHTIAMLCYKDIETLLSKNLVARLNCHLNNEVYQELLKLLTEEVVKKIDFKINNEYKAREFKVFVKT